jgi:hypothetical protein
VLALTSVLPPVVLLLVVGSIGRRARR